MYTIWEALSSLLAKVDSESLSDLMSLYLALTILFLDGYLLAQDEWCR